ncbi:MAG: hypothetical protein WCJ35_08695 [Planctomycetota bacterium]
MIHSVFHPRSYLFVYRLLIGLLLVAWLVPAVYGEGWPLWPFNTKDKPGKPDKIVALWNDTILTQAGQPPIRGFGGRLMFYEGKKEEPIKVEGTLMVYVFDETDRDANNARPDRKYVFTPQQFPLHYSKSKIGDSYSVWLPWDEVGGMQKEFTLIVRFQPKEGAVAVSDPSRQLLPGRTAPSRTKAPAVLSDSPGPSLDVSRSQGNEGVLPTSYQVPATDGTGALQAQWQRRITTTTISVPSASAIRSTINSPQASPAAGNYHPGAGPASPTPGPWRNSLPQNYPPPGYAPQTTPSSVSPGLQLRSGFAPARQWPLGEPLARLSRDRALVPPRPAGSPYGPATPPGQEPTNAGLSP